jgi:hypothetical protein
MVSNHEVGAMRCKSLLLLPCLAVAGCTTGPSLQSQMAVFVGASPQALVQGLGVPDKKITVNDTQYFAYTLVNQVDYWNDGYNGFYNDGYSSVYSCEATFILMDDRVSNVTLRGNDCD